METVPEELSPNLRAYFTRIFTRIDDMEQDDVPEYRTSMPLRPIVGKLYYFNNAVLPTIAAEGLWVYKSTGWTLVA